MIVGLKLNIILIVSLIVHIVFATKKKKKWQIKCLEMRKSNTCLQNIVIFNISELAIAFIMCEAVRLDYENFITV